MNTYSLSARADEVIDGLKTKNARLEERVAELTEQRDAAQDLRDEAAGERDRARATAVELEQQLAAVRDYLASPVPPEYRAGHTAALRWFQAMTGEAVEARPGSWDALLAKEPGRG